MRPFDKIFICARCNAEIHGLEKIINDYQQGGQGNARKTAERILEQNAQENQGK